jgi:hypothetical protein
MDQVGARSLVCQGINIEIPANTVRNSKEDYYENDPIYYNGASRQGTYQ